MPQKLREDVQLGRSLVGKDTSNNKIFFKESML